MNGATRKKGWGTTEAKIGQWLKANLDSSEIAEKLDGKGINAIRELEESKFHCFDSDWLSNDDCWKKFTLNLIFDQG